VYRPAPGQISTTELDIKKMYRLNHVFGMCEDLAPREEDLGHRLALLKKQRAALQARRDRRTVKVSKCAETYIEFFRLYEEYDPVIPSTTGCTDTSAWVLDVWDRETERQACEAQPRRIARWAFSGWELLKDPVGRDHFHAFLEREYATENLLFVEAVWQLKKLPVCEVGAECSMIWSQFLGPQAEHPVNVDSQSYRVTEENMRDPDRWSFDIACAHLYYLMTSDSYSRYLRSSHYKDFLEAAKKKTVKSFPLPLPKLSSAKQNIINAKEQIKDGLAINSF